MKLRYSILLLGFCACFIPKTNAQNYDELIREVISSNPEIAISTASNRSELMSIKSENNLPDPELEFEHQWGQHNIGNKWAISLSQSFEWPGTYNVRSNAFKTTSKAIAYLDRSNYIDKQLEIKLLFIDIVNIHKNMALTNEVMEHMSQLKAKYHQGYELGEVSLLDVNKIDIEHIAISRKYNDLEIQLNTLKSSLSAIAGGNDCSNIISKLTEYPQDKLLSEEEYTKLIAETDPQLSYSSLMAQAQALNLKAAKLGMMPGFSLGYIHNYELGERFNGLKIGISLPLFSTKNKTKAAQFLQESYDLQTTALHVNKLTSMYSERTNIVRLNREIQQSKPIFEKSDNLLLLKKALDGGEISLLNYLQEVNYFLSAQQDYMNIVYQYHYALARLNKYTL